MEIVRFSVNDDRFADYLPHVKSPGEHFHVCFSVIGQQRRQIPRMVGMRRFAGIEMAAGVGKTVSVTICALMDMECKEPCLRSGKSGDLHFHQDAILSLEESHNSTHRRVAAVTHNPCSGTEKIFLHQSIAPASILFTEAMIDTIDKKSEECYRERKPGTAVMTAPILRARYRKET